MLHLNQNAIYNLRRRETIRFYRATELSTYFLSLVRAMSLKVHPVLTCNALSYMSESWNWVWPIVTAIESNVSHTTQAGRSETVHENTETTWWKQQWNNWNKTTTLRIIIYKTSLYWRNKTTKCGHRILTMEVYKPHISGGQRDRERGQCWTGRSEDWKRHHVMLSNTRCIWNINHTVNRYWNKSQMSMTGDRQLYSTF